MKYPAIVYGLSNIDPFYADDSIYMMRRKFDVTLIDKNPNSEFITKLLGLPFCRFDRHFKADNLNHYTYELYF